VGGATYRFPTIEAQELQIWPKRTYPAGPCYPVMIPGTTRGLHRGTRGGMDTRTGGTITIEGMKPRREYPVTSVVSYRRTQSPSKEEQSQTDECTWNRVDCSVYDLGGLDR